jgi:protein tyrosine/serine phosphatase
VKVNNQSSRRRGKRVALVAVMAVALIGAGAWLWQAQLHDWLFPKRWGVVVPGQIYRSGQISPSIIKHTLESHNIKVIVDLNADKRNNETQAAEAKAANELGIERRIYPLAGDGTGDIHQYAEAIARMDKAVHDGQPVLVHCAAGTQRTGGVIAAYRLLVKRDPPADVLAELRQYDWTAERNPVLIEYLNNHMSELATQLVQRGVIQTVPDPLPQLTLTEGNP